MTTYNLYSQSPPVPFDPQAYHLHMVHGKRKELVKLKERYEKKHEKYSKALDRLMWLNTCSGGLSVAFGISSVATLSMFIGLPVSIPLAAISLAGARVSGITMGLTKEYQKRLAKIYEIDRHCNISISHV